MCAGNSIAVNLSKSMASGESLYNKKLCCLSVSIFVLFLFVVFLFLLQCHPPPVDDRCRAPYLSPVSLTSPAAYPVGTTSAADLLQYPIAAVRRFSRLTFQTRIIAPPSSAIPPDPLLSHSSHFPPSYVTPPLPYRPHGPHGPGEQQQGGPLATGERSIH